MKNQTILIIDDNHSERYLLKRQLKDAGVVAVVLEKNSGNSALEFLENIAEGKKEYADGFPPGLIFLDINMPGIDGFEFLEKFSKLREEVQYLSSVIMMFSTSEQTEDHTKAMTYDFVKDYIVKGSLQSEQLRKKVDEVFSL